MSRAEAIRIQYQGAIGDRTELLDAMSATVTVGQLAFQVHAMHAPPDMGGFVARVRHGNWDESTLPIWPPVDAQSWPPKASIIDVEMDQFIRRWDGSE